MYSIGISFHQTCTAMHKLRSLRSSARVYALLLLSQTSIVNKVRPLSTTKYSSMRYRYLDKRPISYVNSDKIFCFSLSKNVRKLVKWMRQATFWLGFIKLRDRLEIRKSRRIDDNTYAFTRWRYTFESIQRLRHSRCHEKRAISNSLFRYIFLSISRNTDRSD